MAKSWAYAGATSTSTPGVLVVQTLVEQGCARFEEPKTDQSAYVELDTKVPRFEYTESTSRGRLALGPGLPRDADFVFCREDGEAAMAAVDLARVSARSRRKLPACRISAFTTFATRTRRSRSPPGIHPGRPSERLGHASVGITLDTYSHAIPAMQADAAAKVAALIDG